MTNTRQQEEFIKGIVSLVKDLDGSQLSRKAAFEAGTISQDEAEKYLQFIWSGPNKLYRMAAALKPALKNRIDYYGIGRKLLMVDEIPVGELPFRDKDIPEFGAVKVAALGNPPLIEYGIRRIVFPTFQLARAYRVSYDDLLVRLFPIFDRAKERVAIATAIAEDKEIFALLKLASEVGPNPWVQVTPGSPITKGAIFDAAGLLENNQLQAFSLVMNPIRYRELMKGLTSTEIDQVTLNVITETGGIGSAWGMNLLVSTKIDASAIYLTTTPEKLGLIPLRKDFESKVADLPWKSAYYVCSYENIGFGIHNTYGVIRIEMAGRSYTPGAYNEVPQF